MTEPKGGAPVLGVDVGGTKVAVGLVDHDGKILAQGRKPMVTNGTAEAGLQAVAGAIDSLVSTVPGGSLANASLVGANTVKGPAPSRVSTRPAAFTAVTSVV